MATGVSRVRHPLSEWTRPDAAVGDGAPRDFYGISSWRPPLDAVVEVRRPCRLAEALTSVYRDRLTHALIGIRG